ncbi:MAG: GNAT family N-acetyltransferase [Clostridia bacterium]|nr:GNAT family N-acetyltransferase [Clostridia bacterium]
MEINILQQLLEEKMRIATNDDLNFLVTLENEAFEPYRASNRDMLKRSIHSDHQVVVIIDDENNEPAGSLILKVHKHSLRIYSIAVLKSAKGKGLGQKLMELAINYGNELQVSQLFLEVDASNKSLIQWYEMLGFEQREYLENYYETSKHALKMILKRHKPKCLIVTDFDTDFFDDMTDVIQTRANDFIENAHYQYSKSMKVFNLCLNYNYQSVGYYVSLLALARKQVAYPSASMIRDINNKKVLQSIGEEIDDLIQKTFKDETEKEIIIHSYFGQNENIKYQHLVRQLNQLYHGPLLTFSFLKKDIWVLNQIELKSLLDLSEEEKIMIKPWISDYFLKHQYGKGSLKNYDYDMAILIDPDEQTPPSDKEALNAIVRAAEKKGFAVTFITEKDYSRIPEFDALFIRTTTSVNDYTYEFSRFAYAEGLVVIDDPWSILRCANKVYLYDALKKAHVAMPKSWIFNKKHSWKDKIKHLPFPLVLKLPDSAFSADVYKVENLNELEEKLEILFMRSELIIGQEFMPSDFDWRIGVLDGKFLFACKYFMANNHWQIMNWNNESVTEGDSETLKQCDVPEGVIKAALDSAHVIGDGLYGVDLKEIDGKIYVIEVNDNPNIDHDVEDLVEKDQLYDKLMDVFYSRLEDTMKIIRPVS